MSLNPELLTTQKADRESFYRGWGMVGAFWNKRAWCPLSILLISLSSPPNSHLSVFPFMFPCSPVMFVRLLILVYLLVCPYLQASQTTFHWVVYLHMSIPTYWYTNSYLLHMSEYACYLLVSLLL